MDQQKEVELLREGYRRCLALDLVNRELYIDAADEAKQLREALEGMRALNDVLQGKVELLEQLQAHRGREAPAEPRPGIDPEEDSLADLTAAELAELREEHLKSDGWTAEEVMAREG